MNWFSGVGAASSSVRPLGGSRVPGLGQRAGGGAVARPRLLFSAPGDEPSQTLAVRVGRGTGQWAGGKEGHSLQKTGAPSCPVLVSTLRGRDLTSKMVADRGPLLQEASRLTPGWSEEPSPFLTAPPPQHQHHRECGQLLAPTDSQCPLSTSGIPAPTRHSGRQKVS